MFAAQATNDDDLVGRDRSRGPLALVTTRLRIVDLVVVPSERRHQSFCACLFTEVGVGSGAHGKLVVDLVDRFPQLARDETFFRHRGDNVDLDVQPVSEARIAVAHGVEC
ncbi:hypothetical protein, partial [Rhodococcus sp. DK17]|uniref:hypothetical protein n=1 Tax=Rhodococcus sp. DK17 TaxID=186196 RepID=UPI00049754F6